MFKRGGGALRIVLASVHRARGLVWSGQTCCWRWSTLVLGLRCLTGQRGHARLTTLRWQEAGPHRNSRAYAAQSPSIPLLPSRHSNISMPGEIRSLGRVYTTQYAGHTILCSLGPRIGPKPRFGLSAGVSV